MLHRYTQIHSVLVDVDIADIENFFVISKKKKKQSTTYASSWAT